MTTIGQAEGELRPSVGPEAGTAVAVSVVVGSGLLVLPGVVYNQLGPSSLYAWLLDAIVVLPLLAVFVWLGRRYPGAAGVAGYVRNAFGARAGTAITVLALGTFIPGLSTVAVAGGYQAEGIVGAGSSVAVLGTVGLLAAAVGVNLLGVSVSSRAQVIATAVFVVAIAAAAIGALVVADPGSRQVLASPAHIPNALPALGAVFFAFTGWEMISFTTGEYRNPRRDFPIVVWGSYLLTLLLYVLLAFAVQYALAPGAPGVGTAPVAALASLSMGTAGRIALSIVGLVLVFANLVGAVWAVSRLVYASARSTLLPTSLTRLSVRRHVPTSAVLVAGAALTMPAAITAAQWIPVDVLFSIAGQSFFVLYVSCLASFLRLTTSRTKRSFGTIALLPCLLMIGTLGWVSLYPIGLLAVGAVVAWRRPTADLVAAEHSAEKALRACS